MRNENESDAAPTKYEPHSVTFAATELSCANSQQPSEAKATKKAECAEPFDFSQLSRMMMIMIALSLFAASGVYAAGLVKNTVGLLITMSLGALRDSYYVT